MKNTVITTNEPDKGLISILKKHSGRDSSGQISVRHQGGRQKRYYRQVDFKRDKEDVKGKVVEIEYDPNRNAYIALIEYSDGEKRYILSPEGLKIKDEIVSGARPEIKVGNAMPLANIPLGIEVHNVELYPGRGGQMVKGAGTSALIIAREGKFVHVKLPSGEIRKFFGSCMATVGKVGRGEYKDLEVGSAGRNILRGIRPTVRGTAQNPRSHPHGGGEGRSGEGMHPKTPWGKPARGKKTRNPKKWSNSLIIKKKK